jgi:hypothetical protein
MERSGAGGGVVKKTNTHTHARAVIGYWLCQSPVSLAIICIISVMHDMTDEHY